MGDKSLQKKQYIVEASRQIFIDKGYATVTMKDIVEGCNISRGGLYLYFDSVEHLFEEVIKQELNSGKGEIGKDLIDSFTQTDLLRIYMKEQKKEILLPEDSLLTALYEYCFSKKQTGVKSIMDDLVKNKIQFLEAVLRKGNEAGEFNVDMPKNMAKNIVYAFEGLKMLSRAGTVTEKMIDDELSYLLRNILVY